MLWYEEVYYANYSYYLWVYWPETEIIIRQYFYRGHTLIAFLHWAHELAKQRASSYMRLLERLSPLALRFGMGRAWTLFQNLVRFLIVDPLANRFEINERNKEARRKIYGSILRAMGDSQSVLGGYHPWMFFSGVQFCKIVRNF